MPIVVARESVVFLFDLEAANGCNGWLGVYQHGFLKKGTNKGNKSWLDCMTLNRLLYVERLFGCEMHIMPYLVT